MTIFTVHIPKGAREPDALAEEIRLVPESGSFAAFVPAGRAMSWQLTDPRGALDRQVPRPLTYHRLDRWP
jgi:hypothetical protein